MPDLHTPPDWYAEFEQYHTVAQWLNISFFDALELPMMLVHQVIACAAGRESAIAEIRKGT